MGKGWNSRETLAERLQRRSTPEPNTGCLLFIGSGPKGYGIVMHNRRVMLAHRAAWIVAVGPIPPGMDVLHHCDTPPCIRVDHLFLGTAQDNVDDMIAKHRARPSIVGFLQKHAQRRAQTHCIRGHPLAGQNLVPQALLIGERVCRRCNEIRLAKFRARRREKGE